MLIQRVTTALILLALLIVSLTIAQPWGFTLFSLLAVAAAMWEWMTLVGIGRRWAFGLACAASIVLWFVSGVLDDSRQGIDPLLWMAALAWCLIAAALFIARRFPPLARNRIGYAVAGLLLPAICWIALMAAYSEGLIFMLSILSIVWIADIAAYFSGKAFGRHKLAPAISPGKTIEGAAGGVVAVLLFAWGCAWVPSLNGSFFSRLAAQLPWWGCALVLIGLVIASIVGDLFESHLKRQASVKDSSHLLPGHGGVLDRLDAALPVIPLAILVSRLW